MGLLQDPIAALNQADWYLKNSNLEQFPGAFELAAGNICRQTLEQVFFILCFFSGMPKNKYMKTDKTLRTVFHMFEQLGKLETTSGKTYWELARRRGPRIRKFARKPRTLNKWRKILNESAHFSSKFRSLDSSSINLFISIARKLFDDKDKYLLVGALNEIFSSGRVWATLAQDSDNTPGICWQVVVSANNLEFTSEDGFSLLAPEKSFLVISSNNIPRGRWPQVPVLVQNSAGISIGTQLVNKRGQPIDIRNMEGILRSFSSTSGERSYLSRRLHQLGLDIKFNRV